MKIYIPSSLNDYFILENVSHNFDIICQAQVNFMSKVIDYVVFLTGYKGEHAARLREGESDYLYRPMAGFQSPTNKMLGNIIKSKSSFQNFKSGYEFTVRISFDENNKMFKAPDNGAEKSVNKILYLDFD